MHRTILAAALILILAVACSKSESTTGTVATDIAATDTVATQPTITSPAGEASPPPPANIAPADRQFAERAARAGMAEVQLATNITNRAQTAEVRAFAQKMLADHNRSNEELTALAKAKGIDPPADVDPQSKALDTELAGLTGPALDRAYMQAMVKDHAATAAEFERASRELTDPDLRAWAAKTLPVLHGHHQLAQETLANLP